MADQPGERPPATRAEPAGYGDAEPTTDPGIARWSGSAAVPAPQPKRSRWARLARRKDAPPVAPQPPASEPPAPEPAPEPPPAVDPWAGQDVAWPADGYPPTTPEHYGLLPTAMDRPADLPPTALERPADLPRTALERPAELPRTAMERPADLPRTAVERPRLPGAPTGPPPAGPPPAGPPPAGGLPAPGVPRKKPSRRERKAAAKALAAAQARLVEARQAADRQAEAQRLAVRRPPGPAPRPVGGPAGPPPRPRRRRRWGRRLAVSGLLGALCCCGVPAWFGWPVAQQYPVSAVLPLTVADLSLRDDTAGRQAAADLADAAMRAHSVADDAFAGVYTDRRGKRVTVAGVTGLRWRPGADVEAELARLEGEYGLSAVQAFDAGETGAHLRCGVGRDDGVSVVVCGWADHGSLATVLLTRRSVAESAQLVASLRASALTRE